MTIPTKSELGLPDMLGCVTPVDSTQASESGMENKEAEAPFQRGFSFWIVIAALCVTAIMASLENSVVVTAGPTIVADLGMGNEYVWIANAFFVSW